MFVSAILGLSRCSFFMLDLLVAFSEAYTKLTSCSDHMY